MIVHYREITAESLKQITNNLIDKNFSELESYFPTRSSFFHEFVILFMEINTCLIFECHIASITLTNHTLEKLLKYALVHNDIGIERKKFFRELEPQYKIAHDNYQSLDFADTINRCCTKGLISTAHKKYLQDEIRIQMRNGFSHSDPNKIIDPKNEKKHYMGKDYKNPDAPLSDIKLDPFVQSQIIGDLARANALPYYKKVVEICLYIQDKLIEKEKTRT